jgi:hypothetical protein
MPDLTERVATLEAIFGTVNLGDWSNDQEVPWWLAIRINPARQLLQSMLTSAVQLAAQARLTPDTKQSEALGRLTSEIIDDWCGTKVPGRFPPRPHWTSIVQQLGLLAESYPARSTLREAAFDLGRRVLERAQELGKQPSR